MNFFDISCVAIIGASQTPGKIGNDLLKNMSDFEGEVYGVNPKYTSPPTPLLQGEGSDSNVQMYGNIQDLPKVPDIAVFAIPAKFVAESLRACGEKGIKRVIIISAGFKEVGDIQAEQELIDIAKQYNIRLLGPNCLGYIDTHTNLNLSFGGKKITSGNIAMISQSGAMAVAFTDWAYEYGLGFSKIISMGNKADLCENDFLEELADDEQTQVIALYLESIEYGQAFYKKAKQISQKKPIIIVKSGMSERGSSAAASHTGALASSADVLTAVFEQSGLHMTNKLEEFFLWGQAFAQTRKRDIPEEMVVITNAGGPGVMITDHMEFAGVKIAELSDSEKDILMQGLPDAASVKNPIDIIGDATSVRYEQILKNIATLDRNLAVCILLTPQTTTDVDMIAEKISAFQQDHPDTLIFTSFMGGHSLGKSQEILESSQVLNYDYPQKAIGVYARLLEQKKWEAKTQPHPPAPSPAGEGEQNALANALKKQNGKLCEPGLVHQILSTYDIATTSEHLVTSSEQIEEIYEKFSGKIVAKIASPDIAHKSDVGGIITDIKTLDQARQAYQDILTSVKKHCPQAHRDGVIFQTQIPHAQEIFVGLKRDASFGDILIVGKGGIYVNVYNDVARKLLPLNHNEIQDMFEHLQITPILQGVRGEPGVDFTELTDTVFKLSQMFMEMTEISEIDINPILANESAAIVVDAKLYL